MKFSLPYHYSWRWVLTSKINATSLDFNLGSFACFCCNTSTARCNSGRDIGWWWFDTTISRFRLKTASSCLSFSSVKPVPIPGAEEMQTKSGFVQEVKLDRKTAQTINTTAFFFKISTLMLHRLHTLVTNMRNHRLWDFACIRLGNRCNCKTKHKIAWHSGQVIWLWARAEIMHEIRSTNLKD